MSLKLLLVSRQEVLMAKLVVLSVACVLLLERLIIRGMASLF